MGPARYRIVVKGRLSERFASAFEGLEFEAKGGRTIVEGHFADETQLYGLIDRLRDLGIELESINATG